MFLAVKVECCSKVGGLLAWERAHAWHSCWGSGAAAAPAQVPRAPATPNSLTLVCKINYEIRNPGTLLEFKIQGK